MNKKKPSKLSDMYDIADDFFESLKANPNFRFESKHKTSLKYFYDNNKSKFFEQLYRQIRYNIDIMNGKTNDIEIKCFDQCGVCGKDVTYILKDNVLSSLDEECFEIEPYSFEVAFPSGKVMFTDWPKYGKEILSHLDKDEMNINVFKGCVLRSQKYATQNVLHVFVGNTCPHVYYKDGLILIGQSIYQFDEELDEELEILIMDDYEQQVSICTDLWWATGIDYEVYKKMAQDVFGEQEGAEKIDEMFEKKIMTIKPGIYKVTHYFDSARMTTDKEPDLYTKLEWVRDI